MMLFGTNDREGPARTKKQSVVQVLVHSCKSIGGPERADFRKSATGMGTRNGQETAGNKWIATADLCDLPAILLING
jgi:hypothetical protein